MLSEKQMRAALGDNFYHYIGKEKGSKMRTEYQRGLDYSKKEPRPARKPSKVSRTEMERRRLQHALEEIRRTVYAAGKYSFRRVLDIACAIHNVSEKEVLGSSRKKKIVRVRNQIAVIMKEKRGMSYPEIGNRLNRDHSTIIHAYNSARSNPEMLNHEYEEILSRLEDYGK